MRTHGNEPTKAPATDDTEELIKNCFRTSQEKTRRLDAWDTYVPQCHKACSRPWRSVGVFPVRY
jgi:hypothetical protein